MAAKDLHASAFAASGPATIYFPITPSDVEDLPYVTTAISAAGSGAIRVKRPDGVIIDIPPFPDGYMFPIRAVRVLANGTTATGLLAYA